MTTPNNQTELQEVVSIYLSQAHDIQHLLFWMNKDESYDKKELFRNSLDALHDKLDSQRVIVGKILQDLQAYNGEPCDGSVKKCNGN